MSDSQIAAYHAMGEAILARRRLSALNQAPASENAAIIAEAERVLIDAGVEMPLPKPRGIVRPARLLEKLDGGQAIIELHKRRAELEARFDLESTLPPPRFFDAEWLVRPVGRGLLLLAALMSIGAALALLLRILR